MIAINGAARIVFDIGVRLFGVRLQARHNEGFLGRHIIAESYLPIGFDLTHGCYTTSGQLLFGRLRLSLKYHENGIVGHHIKINSGCIATHTVRKLFGLPRFGMPEKGFHTRRATGNGKRARPVGAVVEPVNLGVVGGAMHISPMRSGSFGSIAFAHHNIGKYSVSPQHSGGRRIVVNVGAIRMKHLAHQSGKLKAISR